MKVQITLASLSLSLSISTKAGGQATKIERGGKNSGIRREETRDGMARKSVEAARSLRGYGPKWIR